MTLPTPQPSDVAIRPLAADDAGILLQAILSASDYGMMLTDLEHRTIACNQRFGSMFGLDIHQAVESGVAEVRAMVLNRIADLDAWLHNLDLVYSDPIRVQVDELQLRNPAQTLRRSTGPVMGPQGEPIGRLWTFLDITQEHKRARIREVLHEVSLLWEPDPAKAYNAVVESVAAHYGSNSLLSIRNGDMMEFWAVGGADNPARDMGGNEVRNSYCQFCIAANEPILVQDASKDPRYRDLLPATVGFTRYAGVPIRDLQGGVIGTLCILDTFSGETLGEEDLQFLSWMGMRISSELARERFVKDRVQAETQALEARTAELEDTADVLDAMVRAFSLDASELSFEDLLVRQAAYLNGLMRFQGTAILHRDPHREDHWQLADGDGVRSVSGPWTVTEPSWVSSSDLGLPWGRSFAYVLPLDSDAGANGFLAFRSQQVHGQDSYRDTHVRAIVEQVSVLLGSKALQSELRSTQRELADAQHRLIQSEKLAVTGTLAASTAHDIRNILASISVEMSFLRDDPIATVEAMQGHLDRFQLLSHRLLSYAKPRMVQRARVDVEDVLTRVFRLMDGQLRISQTTLIFEPCGPAWTMGDAHQLEHLFANLILNSVQAMAVGGRLTVAVSRSGGLLTILVKDDGPGMSPEVQSRIFEPFVSTRNEGFGLGLYSCRRIVADHGGQLTVHSALGEGATFTIQLPEAP